MSEDCQKCGTAMWDLDEDGNCPACSDIVGYCLICHGTGISSYTNHGQGEDNVEAIKCENCEGFGYCY